MALSEVKPQLLTTMKERISPICKQAVVQSKLAWERVITRRRMVPWMVGGFIATLLIVFAMLGGASWYERHHDAIAPLLTLGAGVAVAGVALARHFAQTDADRQRRITEGFSKAVEQLASEKIEIRLGGIYTLERISRESLDDYGTIMETLCAFVRERAGWKEGEQLDEAQVHQLPPTDIAAVLAVIVRRPEIARHRERSERPRLSLRKTDLRWADLSGAHLEGADLAGTHLEEGRASVVS